MPGILWAVIKSAVQADPVYPVGTPHHITLQFGVEREDWEHLIGTELTVEAIAHCHNERVQAIAVVLPVWCPRQNAYPHITVSWVPDANPVESNQMLATWHHRKKVSYPVQTVIEWLEWEKIE